MGQASMRKWLRRAKHALDHCWCGATLKADATWRFMRCPEHGVAPSARSAGEPLGEFEHFDRSTLTSLRREALAAREERRARRRHDQAVRNGRRWNFQNVRVTVGGVEVRGLKSLSYELVNGNEQMKTWAKEAGLPSPWPDAELQTLKERVRAADHYGPLHVVLDDVNLEDEYLRQGILSAGQGERWSDAQLGRDLLALSLDDRARVFGYPDWAAYEADGQAISEAVARGFRDA